MSVILLVCSTAGVFAIIWWFVTRELRRPASLRRFVSWLGLIACLFISPFIQILMVRQIVAERELADTIAYGWVISMSLCGLVFMFTLLRRIENENNNSRSNVPKETR